MKEIVKNKIKKWLLDIDRQENLPNDIVALNFNILGMMMKTLIGLAKTILYPMTAFYL